MWKSKEWLASFYGVYGSQGIIHFLGAATSTPTKPSLERETWIGDGTLGMNCLPKTITCQQVGRRLKKNHVRGNAPPMGYIKINFDGSVKRGEATTGYIIRDFRGRMIKAGTTKLGEGSVLLAKAIALRNGVKATFEMGFRRLYIEGDSTCVIQALRGEFVSPWSIDHLICDTGIFLSICGVVNVCHTYREGNRAADWIANEGHHYTNNFC